MTATDIKIFSELLDSFVSQKADFNKRHTNEFSQTISQSFSLNKLEISIGGIGELNFNSEQEDSILEKVIKTNKKLLEDFQSAQIDAKKKSKETSCNFNVLKLFSINEPMHSFLLANILNPNAEHGQGNLFLISFLKKLGIESPEEGQWTITAEKGRIDILIKRRHPHSVIVIENKSNGAEDQPNQLYRYWYREIYLPHKLRGNDFSKQHPEKYYQVLFLTPADWKQPSEQTTLKPNGWDSELPPKMPLETKIWKFNHEISDWLREVYNEIPKENHRLKEYIKQYIEFWN